MLKHETSNKMNPKGCIDRVDTDNTIYCDGDRGITRLSARSSRRSSHDAVRSCRLSDNETDRCCKPSYRKHSNSLPRHVTSQPTNKRAEFILEPPSNQTESNDNLEDEKDTGNRQATKKKPCKHDHTVIPIEAALPPQLVRSDIPADRRSMPEGFHNHVVSMSSYLMNNAEPNSSVQQLAQLLSQHLHGLLKKRNKAIEDIVEGMMDYNPNMLNTDVFHRAIEDSCSFQPTDQCDLNCRRNANFNQWLYEIYSDKTKNKAREVDGEDGMDSDDDDDDDVERDVNGLPIWHGVHPTFDSELRTESPRKSRNESRCQSYNMPSKYRDNEVPQFKQRSTADDIDLNIAATSPPSTPPIYDRTAINRLTEYDTSTSASSYTTPSTSSSESQSDAPEMIRRTKTTSAERLNPASNRRQSAVRTAEELNLAAAFVEGPSLHHLLPLSSLPLQELVQSSSQPIDSMNDSDARITQANTLFNSKLLDPDNIDEMNDSRIPSIVTGKKVVSPQGRKSFSGEGPESRGPSRQATKKSQLCDGMSYYLLKNIASSIPEKSSPPFNSSNDSPKGSLEERRKTWQAILGYDGDSKPTDNEKAGVLAKDESEQVSPYPDHDITDEDGNEVEIVNEVETVLSVSNLNQLPGSSRATQQLQRRSTSEQEDTDFVYADTFYDELPEFVDKPEDVQDFIAPVAETILDVYTSAHGIVVMREKVASLTCISKDTRHHRNQNYCPPGDLKSASPSEMGTKAFNVIDTPALDQDSDGIQETSIPNIDMGPYAASLSPYEPLPVPSHPYGLPTTIPVTPPLTPRKAMSSSTTMYSSEVSNHQVRQPHTPHKPRRLVPAFQDNPSPPCSHTASPCLNFPIRDDPHVRRSIPSGHKDSDTKNFRTCHCNLPTYNDDYVSPPFDPRRDTGQQSPLSRHTEQQLRNLPKKMADDDWLISNMNTNPNDDNYLWNQIPDRKKEKVCNNMYSGSYNSSPGNDGNPEDKEHIRRDTINEIKTPSDYKRNAEIPCELKCRKSMESKHKQRYGNFSLDNKITDKVRNNVCTGDKCSSHKDHMTKKSTNPRDEIDKQMMTQQSYPAIIDKSQCKNNPSRDKCSLVRDHPSLGSRKQTPPSDNNNIDKHSIGNKADLLNTSSDETKTRKRKPNPVTSSPNPSNKQNSNASLQVAKMEKTKTPPRKPYVPSNKTPSAHTLDNAGVGAEGAYTPTDHHPCQPIESTSPTYLPDTQSHHSSSKVVHDYAVRPQDSDPVVYSFGCKGRHRSQSESRPTNMPAKSHVINIPIVKEPTNHSLKICLSQFPLPDDFTAMVQDKQKLSPMSSIEDELLLPILDNSDNANYSLDDEYEEMLDIYMSPVKDIENKYEVSTELRNLCTHCRKIRYIIKTDKNDVATEDIEVGNVNDSCTCAKDRKISNASQHHQVTSGKIPLSLKTKDEEHSKIAIHRINSSDDDFIELKKRYFTEKENQIYNPRYFVPSETVYHPKPEVDHRLSASSHDSDHFISIGNFENSLHSKAQEKSQTGSSMIHHK